jgi:hypothetical protein
VLASGGIAAAGPAYDRPAYDVPFPCGQQWHGSTRDTHSPSYWSVDFNREADERDLVVASAPGTVSTATNLGDLSYGKYVVVDHGGGYSTVHAHLSKLLVVAGQAVDAGAVLGRVGDTGNSFGAHLHYEQRLNGSDEAAVFAGTRFTYNTVATSANCAAVPVTGDWNGNGRTDVGVYRHGAASGRFRERMPDGHVVAVQYGLPGDTPLIGDWNGDGRSEVGSWRPLGHSFWLRMPKGASKTIPFGTSRDVAVTGDWDGDKTTDVGVWRPATATFLLRLGDGSVTSRQFGRTGGIPVTGNWDGGRRYEVGVFNPTAAVFSLRMSDGTVVKRQLGVAGDLPVTGDWNGNGVTDIGVWSPSNATFSLLHPGGYVRSIQFGKAR